MPVFEMDVKFLEIVVNLVREQNEQLLLLIAEQENLSKRELAKFIPTKFVLKKMLLDYLNGEQPPFPV